MIARLRGILFTAHPYERDVLLLLAWFRACFVTAAGIAAFWAIWFSGLPEWARVTLVAAGIPVEAFLAALLSADFLEHYAKRWFLGYTYNPRVMAIGELELYNGPVLPRAAATDFVALWEAHKYDVLYYKDTDGTFKQALWEGDPGAGRFGGE